MNLCIGAEIGFADHMHPTVVGISAIVSRMGYPIPTIVTVSIETDTGLAARARVTEMRLADHDY